MKWKRSGKIHCLFKNDNKANLLKYQKMSLTETFCIQVLFTYFHKGEKECIYWDDLPPSSEKNKIMPSTIIFSLFIFIESSPPLHLFTSGRRYYFGSLCSSMKWAIGCLISVILKDNSRNLKYLNSLSKRGIWRKESSCVLDPCNFFLCPLHWVQMASGFFNQFRHWKQLHCRLWWW